MKVFFVGDKVSWDGTPGYRVVSSRSVHPFNNRAQGNRTTEMQYAIVEIDGSTHAMWVSGSELDDED